MSGNCNARRSRAACGPQRLRRAVVSVQVQPMGMHVHLRAPLVLSDTYTTNTTSTCTSSMCTCTSKYLQLYIYIYTVLASNYLDYKNPRGWRGRNSSATSGCTHCDSQCESKAGAFQSVADSVGVIRRGGLDVVPAVWIPHWNIPKLNLRSCSGTQLSVFSLRTFMFLTSSATCSASTDALNLHV